MDLTDTQRTLYPTTAETFFSSTHETFSKIDYMLGHRISLSKFKKTEIIPNIFSDHNGMKLEIHNKKKTKNFTNMWKLNNTLLNNQWIKEEIKREIKSFLRQMKMEIQHAKTYGMQQKQS